MRNVRQVVTGRHLDIRAVACLDDHPGWSAPEDASGCPEVVLVHRGRFRLRSGGQSMAVDPTVGYLQPAGREASFAHPAGGDVCISIRLADDRLRPGPNDVTELRAIQVDAQLELAHRLVLRETADPDFATVDAVIGLLEIALRRSPSGAAPGRYELADRAREAILADDPDCGSLVTLATRVGTSPAHLSRTFRHHAGQSITRYRNRVRISRAIGRIDDGETDLAGLAVTLGFSDQAHLSRTMRRETGHTPGGVRALLNGGPGSEVAFSGVKTGARGSDSSDRPHPTGQPAPTVQSA